MGVVIQKPTRLRSEQSPKPASTHPENPERRGGNQHQSRKHQEHQSRYEETNNMATTEMEETGQSNHHDDGVLSLSGSESSRERLFTVLDGCTFQILGGIVIFFVVGFGALFFFLLMGWHLLCRPRMNCEPRNWWLNFGIQGLNVLFTYMVTVSLPWRYAHFRHVFGWSDRDNKVGRNLYGQPAAKDDAWSNMALSQRKLITTILMINTITQYANQITRIRYSTFASADVFPANLWTNIFFAMSFCCAGLAAVLLWPRVWRMVKADPNLYVSMKRQLELMQKNATRSGDGTPIEAVR